MDITKALMALAPGAEFSLINEDYDQIQWFSTGITKPTKAQVDAKIAELQAVEPMRLLRKERDRLIAETDWWVLPDRTATEAQLAYRQALRDLPDNSTPILDNTTIIGVGGVTWPTKPS